MSINEKLISLLAMPGWTQTKVAERLGVSQSTVNRWTKGTAPEGDHRDSLSDLYNEVYGFSEKFDLMPVRGVIEEAQTIRWVDRADQWWTPKPPTVYKKLTAIRVASDTLLPEFAAQAVIYFGDPTQPADGVGSVVVAELPDGRFMIRKILRGSSEGKWTLTSPRASDLTDIQVENVHPIEWVKPYVWETPPF